MSRMGPWGDSSSISQASERQPSIIRSSPYTIGRSGSLRSVVEREGNEPQRSSILRRVLSDLNSAIVPREIRLAALMSAIAEFNHNDERRHDEELDARADRVLFQKLAFALTSDQSSEEVGLVCSALEMVYRGSRNRVSNAVNEFGMTALPLILMMIGGSPRRNKKIQTRSRAQMESGYSLENKSVASFSMADKSMESIDCSKSCNTKTVNTNDTFKTEEMEDVKDITSEFIDDVSEITGWTDKLPSQSLPKIKETKPAPRTGDASIASEKISYFSDFGMSVDADMSVETSKDNLEIKEEKEVNPNGVFKILKVLRYFSRVLTAMVPLAHFTGLLDSLLYQLEKLSTDGLLQELEDLTSCNTKNSPMTTARVDTMAIMVNLACAEENKVMMVDHPGLLDCVINVARNDPCSEAREHSAIVFMNLSYSAQNKEVLAEYEQFLSTLTKLMGDPSPYTRKYAASALFALASVVSKNALATTYCGNEILEALRHVLLHDPSDEARVKAAEALHNMTRGKSGDGLLKITSHPNLLDALAEAVISDYSADVRAYCARALESMSKEIHFPLDSHKDLVRALIKASQWTKTTSIAEALKLQASVVSNRIALVSYPGLLEALAALASLSGSADSYIRSCALYSIERLSTEPQNTPIIARNKEIMEALTREGFRSQRYGESDQNMIKAVKNLASALNQ